MTKSFTILLAVAVGIHSTAGINSTVRTMEFPESRETQIVARFPEGIWTSTMLCGDEQIQTAKHLATMCMRAITPDSPQEERLACSIISAPNSIGRIPFGMYGPSTMLDTELTSLTSDSMTHIFSPCALAQMIENGCFTFDTDLGHATYKSASYQTESEYANSVADSYGVSASAGVGFGIMTASAAYASQTSSSSASQSSTKISSVSKSWQHNIGVLSMDTCKHDLQSYIDPSYLKLWEELERIPDRANILKSDALTKLMEMGFYIPSSFAFAIRYNANVQSSFDSSTKESSDTMSQALSAAASVSVGLFSGSVSASMENAMASTAKSSGMSMTSRTHETKYGICDFHAAMDNDAEQWINIFRECASETNKDLMRLDRAAYIPFNGFISVLDYLHESNIIPSNVAEALNVYFLECRCSSPLDKNGDRRYHCTTGDNLIMHFGFQSEACTSTSPWYPTQEALKKGRDMLEYLEEMELTIKYYEK